MERVFTRESQEENSCGILAVRDYFIPPVSMEYNPLYGAELRKKRRERSKRPSYSPSFTPLPSLTALHCVLPFSIPLSPHSNSHLPLYLRACERFEGRMNGGEKRWCREISPLRVSRDHRHRTGNDLIRAVERFGFQTPRRAPSVLRWPMEDDNRCSGFALVGIRGLEPRYQ